MNLAIAAVCLVILYAVAISYWRYIPLMCFVFFTQLTGAVTAPLLWCFGYEVASEMLTVLSAIAFFSIFFVAKRTAKPQGKIKSVTNGDLILVSVGLFLATPILYFALDDNRFTFDGIPLRFMMLFVSFSKFLGIMVLAKSQRKRPSSLSFAETECRLAWAQIIGAALGVFLATPLIYSMSAHNPFVAVACVVVYSILLAGGVARLRANSPRLGPE